jgi:hypothetical protein
VLADDSDAFGHRRLDRGELGVVLVGRIGIMATGQPITDIRREPVDLTTGLVYAHLEP